MKDGKICRQDPSLSDLFRVYPGKEEQSPSTCCQILVVDLQKICTYDIGDSGGKSTVFLCGRGI